MKKLLYFTIDGRESDQRNGIKVYQEFQYDTETGELKFIDKSKDETKELSLGSASSTSEEETPEP